MALTPSTFQVRAPGPLAHEDAEVEVVRTQGPSGDVWTLTNDELGDLAREIEDARELSELKALREKLMHLAGEMSNWDFVPKSYIIKRLVAIAGGE